MKEKILVVDDEKSIRNLLTETLQELGYRCESVENGLKCLEAIRSPDAFDIVLLDIHMPELNGIETLKKLKSDFPEISVIMISASREAEDVRVALKEGAYDYIFKPFGYTDVETVIRRAVERSELIKQNRDYQRNLEEKVERQTREILSLYSDTLEAMILALDLRERETGYHSYRVTEYALTLAKRMNLSGPDLSVVANGALLHDIGKIGVPDSILLKAGELTAEEWEVMKKHPTFGYELLKKIGFLEQASIVVLRHHERFDGKGYPDGISGEDIPLGARIFSIVDAMDALTSDRVYRNAVSFDRAIEEISSVSGSQFDPKVIDFFLSAPQQEWVEIRRTIENSGPTYLKKLLHRLTK